MLTLGCREQRRRLAAGEAPRHEEEAQESVGGATVLELLTVS